MNEKNKIISELRIQGFDVSFDKEKCILRRYIGQDASVTLPDIIDEIGEYAFYDNKKIKSVSFGKNIKTIATSAFEDCSGLEYISPLAGVAEIYPYAFSYTIKLKNITFSDNLINIGEYAFSGSGLEEVNIPDSVKMISFKAFFACPKLHTVNIGGNNATYEESAFANCMKLKSLTVSEGVASLGRRAFSCCKVLETINISKNTVIGEDAFEAVPGEFRYL